MLRGKVEIVGHDLDELMVRADDTPDPNDDGSNLMFAGMAAKQTLRSNNRNRYFLRADEEDPGEDKLLFGDIDGKSSEDEDEGAPL